MKRGTRTWLRSHYACWLIEEFLRINIYEDGPNLSLQHQITSIHLLHEIFNNVKEFWTVMFIFQRNHRWFGPENRNFGNRDPPRWPRGTLYPQNLVLTSRRSGDRSVGNSSLADSGNGVFMFMKPILLYYPATMYIEDNFSVQRCVFICYKQAGAVSTEY
jgi:hypothetical protein